MIALLWLLLIVPLFAGLLAQDRVRARFARYRAMPNGARLTGAEAARALLDALGLRRVRVEVVPGALTDHYDGAAGALRLSREVALEPSVAALAIAAHEVSHAHQDASGSRAYRLRMTVGEPLGRLAPWSGLFFIGGFWLGIPVLMTLSLLYVGGLVAFALATLPVEIGASRFALRMLADAGLTAPAEAGAVRRVLRAAALTYVVGLLRQVGLFLALVLILEATRRGLG
ncbi:zinc metallopeptidase [Miltoncostaea marina]|uniref:zinc metallopeptidase n=1 Tax=Miltoncostaea marina TaxID=2843215 RepID=UPI001C3C3215|nr:zinc metallopeptidase [Miltoncostaea marina]